MATADPTPDIAALIDEMTAKAEKAAPSRWVVCQAGSDGWTVTDDSARDHDVTVGVYDVVDAEHIAASCPANVLALVAAYKAMTERAQTAERERDEVATYAQRLQIALTGLAGGGSENFVRHGDGFRADIFACMDKVNARQAETMESVKRFLRESRTERDRATAAEARVAELTSVVREVAILYDMTWGNTEKTDHDLAEAFEPVAIRASRLLSPPKDVSGKTMGAR